MSASFALETRGLAKLALFRLARTRQAWLSLAGWSAFLLVSILIRKSHAAPHATESALDLYASIAVPILVYGLVGSAVGRGSLATSGRPLALLGAHRARVALSTVLVTALVSSLVVGALGALTVAAAHGTGDPPLGADARQTFAFGALAAAAYSAYFMFGTSLIGGVWGRGLFLVLDWVMGSDDGFGALLTPRAHLRNLLGGEAPFEALPWESSAALFVLAIVFAAFAVRRAARVRV